MSNIPYKPRRANKRWLEEAPEYVLDVFDNKGKSADRYTVLFGGSLFDPRMLRERKVHYLGMSDDPTHPWFGVSMWGECVVRPLTPDAGAVAVECPCCASG